MPPLNNTSNRAFSLVELMVAIFVASILVFIAFVVTGKMQSGISRSLQRAQITLAGQALDNRFRLDAKAMLGPNSTPGSAAGAVVIVPAWREGYIPLRNGQMSTHMVRLRSDQLAFVTDVTQGTWVNGGSATGKKWSSVMPADLHAGAPTQSNQALIWYGAMRSSSSVPADGGNGDAFYQAHQWQLGRQMKLLTGGAIDTTALGITAGSDTVAGTAGLLANEASTGKVLPGGSTVRAPSWPAANYITYLANSPTGSANVPAGAPASSYSNYTNVPVDNLNVDPNGFRLHPAEGSVQGVQLTDVSQANLRFIDHCSEVIVQWAGDLDKDGIIDTYPAGHPLGGSIIWYPEEVHDHGNWYNSSGPLSRANARMQAPATTMYQKIANNSASNWYNGSFPTGFLGPSTSRFGGHGTQVPATWHKGFMMEYGEQDGALISPGVHAKAAVSTPNLPAPYVFTFDDDQYRKVRYGFRQDGSVYRNGCDGFPVQAWPSGGRHHFPYPPTTNTASGAGYMDNPDPAVLYANRNAPSGPYPIAASMTANPATTTGIAVATALPTTNFADAAGSIGYPGSGGFTAAWTAGMFQTTAFGPTTANAMRLQPTGSYPNGRLVRLQEQRTVAGGRKPGGSYMMVYITLGANSPTGEEPLFDPFPGTYRSEALPGFRLGRKLVIQPSIEAGFAAGALSGSQITANGWFSVTLGAAATGVEQQINVLPWNNGVSSSFGPGNNYIANYQDIYSEWLEVLNTPALQGTRADWRNPQSDWPKLIRMRLRLHDSRGEIASSTEEFLLNGRDDDGDGVVDNPGEGTMSGVWYEFIMAVPYPRDPTPRTLAP